MLWFYNLCIYLFFFQISYEISLDYEVEKEKVISPIINSLHNDSNNILNSKNDIIIEGDLQIKEDLNQESKEYDDKLVEYSEENKLKFQNSSEIVVEEELDNPWSMTFENTKSLLKEFTESSMRIHRLSDEIHEFCSTITSLTYK